jgi:hypothetical protein
MTLTHEDVQLLTAQFDASDHEERDGRTYIRERAITDRLDAVDPSWTWELLGQPVWRDGSVIQSGRLTVKGVWRDGVGMESVRITKTGSEANEAEKSAATDALKRAARLFGIGRYLLDLGKGQKPQRQTQQQTRQVDKTTGEITGDDVRFVCTKLTVRLNAQKKPYLIFEDTKNPSSFITDFSRDRLRKAGYNVDAWAKPGEYALDPPAWVSAAPDAKGYLNVTDIQQDIPL